MYDHGGYVRTVFLIGPAGCGKTTVGQEAARATRAEFVDADDYHSAEAKARIAAGQPLNDGYRIAWVQRLINDLQNRFAGSAVVVACSLLTRSLRQQVAAQLPGVVFVSLVVPPDTLRQRLRKRPDHFAGPSICDMQLATFEGLTIDEGITLDGTLPIQILVVEIDRQTKDLPPAATTAFVPALISDSFRGNPEAG